MFNKIILKNFQSHKKSILNLIPGVNVIIGSSDVGKTAIVRALRWLVWNRPQGEAFRSYWGGITSIKVQTDEGIIKRIRGNKNQYFVNELELNAIKSEVPAEVNSFLNMNEINLQTQFSRPFLLDSSPGEVAQHFNKTAHLDAIDLSNKNVQHWVRQINQDILVNEEKLKELEENLKEFKNLDVVEELIIFIEKLTNKKKEYEKQIIQLTSLIQNWKQILQEQKDLEKITQLESILNIALTITEQKNKLKKEKEIISTIISNYNFAISEINELSNSIKIKEKKFHSSFENNICPLCEQVIK